MFNAFKMATGLSVLLSLTLASSEAANFYQPNGEQGTVGGCSEEFTENLAYDDPSPKIPEAMTEHSKTMCKMVIEIVPGKVYLAWGYALASPTMIVGDDGLIIIDPPDSVEATQIAYDDMREVANTDLPVKAIVYSHSHPDHFPGVRVFTNDEDVASVKVPPKNKGPRPALTRPSGPTGVMGSPAMNADRTPRIGPSTLFCSTMLSMKSS